MTLKLDNERLTKKQVCSILQIGYSTLGRWMREGKIKFQREQAAKFESAVFFRRDDLTAFLPSPEQLPAPVAPPLPAPAAAPEPSHPESKDIRTWAERYSDGDAPDSCGNYRDGANDRYPETGASLLGPVPRDVMPEPKPSCTAHMNQKLLPKLGGDASTQYLNSLERQRDIGTISQATYDELTSAASKARRMSGQDHKIYLDRAAIKAAYRHGYSR